MEPECVEVTGNIKFDQVSGSSDAELTDHFRRRFGISAERPLIVAASTHEPEERYVLEALEGELGHTCRLMLVPRHPERFNAVASLLTSTPYTCARRSADETEDDKDADVILLDTIGELRAVYPLAEIVFVGGSLIPHGGQSVLEPALEGKAIVTGPYTHNFDSAVKRFLDDKAILQTNEAPDEFQISERLFEVFTLLLENPDRRASLGHNAAAVMARSGGDATSRTMRFLRAMIKGASD
jgi:3-deoxy-D-manno-octulosonic-acid transferase